MENSNITMNDKTVIEKRFFILAYLFKFSYETQLAIIKYVDVFFILIFFTNTNLIARYNKFNYYFLLNFAVTVQFFVINLIVQIKKSVAKKTYYIYFYSRGFLYLFNNLVVLYFLIRCLVLTFYKSYAAPGKSENYRTVFTDQIAFNMVMLYLQGTALVWNYNIAFIYKLKIRKQINNAKEYIKSKLKSFNLKQKIRNLFSKK